MAEPDNKMRISIAMATYNGARYVDEQLTSLVEQTRLPDELIVSDDGSSDDTMERVEAFAREALFDVKVVRNVENVGYAKNFENAVSRCTGDVIFLCDQDDVWAADKISVVEQRFAADQDLLLLVNDAELTDANLSPTGLTKANQILDSGLGLDEFITGCCTAFRRELQSIASPMPAAYSAHDEWYHVLATRVRRRRVMLESLQYYRRHEENTSQWFASRPTRTTRWTVIRDYAPGDPLQYCQIRMKKLQALKKHMIEKNDVIAELLGDRAEQAEMLAQIDDEFDAVERRASFLSKGKLTRPFSIVPFYLEGGYRYFSGWKSLVKDLFQ